MMIKCADRITHNIQFHLETILDMLELRDGQRNTVEALGAMKNLGLETDSFGLHLCQPQESG